jgi:hypothetical protein
MSTADELNPNNYQRRAEHMLKSFGIQPGNNIIKGEIDDKKVSKVAKKIKPITEKFRGTVEDDEDIYDPTRDPDSPSYKPNQEGIVKGGSGSGPHRKHNEELAKKHPNYKKHYNDYLSYDNNHEEAHRWAKNKVFRDMTNTTPVESQSEHNEYKPNQEGIVKGGEGSRGGKVIGHTKSGKPVYEHAVAAHIAYDNFTKQDRTDAALLHHKEAMTHHEKRMKSGISKEDKQKHDKAFDDHSKKYKQHKLAFIEKPSEHDEYEQDHIDKQTEKVEKKHKEMKKGWDPEKAFDDLMKGGPGSGRKLSVSHEKYSWGHLVKVGEKHSFHAVMHPEHIDAVNKLQPGQSHHFVDEQNKRWKVTKKMEGNEHELHGQGKHHGDFTMPKETQE